jgi:hypothetical protein
MQRSEHAAKLKKTKRAGIRLAPEQGPADRNTTTQNTGTITEDSDTETKVPADADAEDVTQSPGAETEQESDTVRPPLRKLNPKRLAVGIGAAPFAVKSVADEAFVTSEYATFYDPITGARVLDYKKKQGELYKSMSTFDSPYLEMPIKSFVLSGYMIKSLERGPYGLVAQDGADFDQALADGDYFHFINRAPAPYDGVARRIVVNTWSQQSSLKLAAALEPLFTDPAVKDSLLSFKAFLSSEPLAEVPKGDKVVIYYNPDATSPGDDRVGNRLVQIVTGTLAEGERDSRIAPFYSGITKGVAWSDERGGASFTSIRAAVIKQTVDENAQIDSEKEFFDLVSAKLRSVGIDPANTHQYMTAAPASPDRRHAAGSRGLQRLAFVSEPARQIGPFRSNLRSVKAVSRQGGGSWRLGRS